MAVWSARTAQPTMAFSILPTCASIPNIVIMAPKDENELQHMLKTAIDHHGPISLRYPRGEGWGVALDEDMKTSRDRQGGTFARMAATS